MISGFLPFARAVKDESRKKTESIRKIFHVNKYKTSQQTKRASLNASLSSYQPIFSCALNSGIWSFVREDWISRANPQFSICLRIGQILKFGKFNIMQVFNIFIQIIKSSRFSFLFGNYSDLTCSWRMFENSV